MKLGIQPLLPTGNYLNKRYSIEMDFPDDSNPKANFKYLNEVITSIHMSEYPLLYKEGMPLFSNYQGDEASPTEKEIQVAEVPDSVQATISDINKCQSPEELQSFWLVSKGNLTILNAYKEKEKQLKDAKK